MPIWRDPLDERIDDLERAVPAAPAPTLEIPPMEDYCVFWESIRSRDPAKRLQLAEDPAVKLRAFMRRLPASDAITDVPADVPSAGARRNPCDSASIPYVRASRAQRSEALALEYMSPGAATESDSLGDMTWAGAAALLGADQPGEPSAPGVPARRAFRNASIAQSVITRRRSATTTQPANDAERLRGQAAHRRAVRGYRRCRELPCHRRSCLRALS
jgi:hypothetical protein